jgi:hypothetical protein
MKKLETQKLFWNKYLYKLVINNRLAPIFRNKQLSYSKSILNNLEAQQKAGQPMIVTKTLRQDVIQEDHFLDAKTVYKYLSKSSDYMLRVERSTLCIYSNDRVWLMDIKADICAYNLEEFWEPNTETINVLDANTIIVDHEIPYEFRVTLRSKGSNSFAKWADKNPKQVKLGPVLKEEMLKNGYVEGMYFYARDDRTLQLCNLMLDNIRRVDRIVSKRNIDK